MKNVLFLIVFAPLLSFCQKQYFQQEANYTINVSLNDKTHTLSAFETIEYVNNSPDTLSFIWFHLWPNAYKNDNTAMAKQLLENGETTFYYSEEKDRGYIDSLNFKVNNSQVKWEFDEQHIDICKLFLNEPLLPGKKVIISTPFKVKIPKGVFSRLGHIGESYQITQWYPKPAVYDRDGWHQMPYLTQGEFYSEFGSFDVSLTLPKNYRVGATGDLQNGEKEIAWLDSLVQITEKIEEFESNMDFPESSKQTKTLRYKQSQVHDFAWFADKRYHVLKGEVELPHSKRKVDTWSMFTNAEADLWEGSIEYINDAIYYYSLWNGDYAYNHMTAVDGALSAGGGMEYPNVTVIGTSGTKFYLETVIMHEVGHNWFYGMLGSNERIHPWLDEGLNSFNENRYIETKYPNANVAGEDRMQKILNKFDMGYLLHKDQYYLGYLLNANNNKDQPIEHHSAKYTDINYGVIVYGKSAVVFDYLMAYLGEETMDRIMQKYFNEWKFKHPNPSDLRKIFEEETSKDLSWFFDDLINTSKKLDYKISKIDKKSNSVTVKNSGDIAGPVLINSMRGDSVLKSIWIEGFEKEQIVNIDLSNADRVVIDKQREMPESNKNNNSIKTKGLLKKTEPLKLQFLGSIDNPDKTQLYFTPFLGWNNYDKTYLGAVIYNSTFPSKKFEYLIAPFYSIATNDLVGVGEIKYSLLPKSGYVQQSEFGVKFKRFSEGISRFGVSKYQKIEPSISIDFKKYTFRSPVKHNLDIRSHIVNTKGFQSDVSTSTNATNIFTDIAYSIHSDKTLHPRSYRLWAQHHEDFFKASFEFNQEITYNDYYRADLRVFAGGFLYNNSNSPIYNLRMDKYGVFDYTYSEYLLGRSDNVRSSFFGHQFLEQDGAFKVPTAIGSSNKYILALNYKTDLPIKLPIGAFTDFGISDNHSLYDAGLYLSLFRGQFEVFAPIYLSNNIVREHEANGYTFIDRVRFKLNIDLGMPSNLVNQYF